jgi:hypothetical protein
MNDTLGNTKAMATPKGTHNMYFSLIDAYRTAQRCGTMANLYSAAATPGHPDNLTAISTIQLMAAETRGESAGFGARQTVNAALKGRPFTPLSAPARTVLPVR